MWRINRIKYSIKTFRKSLTVLDFQLQNSLLPPDSMGGRCFIFF
nr:MAG TPA: hypothetical protein [Bacteriophage sp.]